MRAIYFFALIALLQNTTRSYAQVRMETIGVEEGLSQGFITSMIQDVHGFIWIGTYDGLNRYDGYTVRRFTTKPFDPWSLQSTFITHLYEDNRQLLWVGTHQGLQVFDPLTERFFSLGLPEFNLPANDVTLITGDGQGAIFVQIPSDDNPNGLYKLNVPADFRDRLRNQKDPLKDFRAEPILSPQPLSLIQCIGDSMILAHGKDLSIFRYSYADKTFHSFDLRQLPGSATDDHNILWGKYAGYIFRWRLPDGRDTVPPANFWLSARRLGNADIGIWVYGEGPFFRKNTHQVISFNFALNLADLLASPDFQREFTSLMDRSPYWNNKILADRSGMLWAASGGWGLRKINPRQRSFESLWSGKSISSLRELPDGRIWIRFFNDDSFVFNTATNQVETPPWGPNRRYYEVFADRKGDCWLLEPFYEETGLQRLMLFEKETGRLTRYAEQIPFLEGVPEKIFEDRDGNIWIVVHQGNLFRCRPGQRKLEHFLYTQVIPNNPFNLRATTVCQDKNGTIWIGTSRGLLRMEAANTASPRFSFLKHDPGNRQSLSIDWITHICPDPYDPDILWLGTRGGGLNRLNTQTQVFTFITETPDGLPDNVVYGILPDNEGNLWCSTNRGLCRFNPQGNTFVTYHESDGLLNTEFNTNSFLHTPDGRFWFGGVNGLNVFRPEAIPPNNLPPQVAITGIQIGGSARLPDYEGSLSLSFEENNVLFEFAALDFSNPATNRFRHRLIGIDKDWVNDGTTHSANYAALPPGCYRFELQGATADSPWSAEPVVFHLTIRPPWYRSRLAWVLYFAVFIGAIWGIIRYREKMFQLEHSARINQIESTRLKEFETVKNQFFANLAHELRTPLTVILGLAKRIQRGVTKEEVEENARNIVEQGDTLLTLTNQILDLAKLESQQFVLNLSNGNISQFVQHQTESLAPLAESKGLRLIVENESPVVWMDFDPAQMQKILNNLIANAIRHSSPGGIIRVETALLNAGNCLRLCVRDEGDGIYPADLPHIFDRFYQGSQSNGKTGASGLGLTLTRDLVRLMGGEVTAESTDGKGSVFTILLPIRNQASRLNDPKHLIPVKKIEKPRFASPNKGNLPLLLILEDNESVADFLRLCLQDHYRIELAEDGEAGIARAIESVPDLILTDVAMPKKDGFEVVSILKNDLRTSHIPIVMLTAKVEQSDRLEGKRRGANAYLTKPFEEQELLLVLNNLLQLQQQWKQRYAAFSGTPAVQSETERTAEDFQPEDEFMQKLYEAFEGNYKDETFNLERLCRLLGMSSSQLDRKLKALTDTPPMQMLRSYRLQKARVLLQGKPKISIKDVCFQTGFKSPSHFSRAFSEEFGMPPSGV